MKLNNRWFVCAPVIVGAAVMLISLRGKAHADSPPSQPQIQFAEETSELMLKTIVAALLQEFAETTPANVEQGKKSISLIFNDRNEDMRLVGEQSPLQANNVPQDPFEKAALTRAMNGLDTTGVDKVQGKWYYRRAVALSNFDPACAMCHTNFGPVNGGQWVGALMLRVPAGN